MRLFISHAGKDKKIVTEFVELLYSMGLTSDDMFCSSIPELGIPFGNNIYQYLRNLIDGEEICTFFMLSENYYNSPDCLNEMGAVWVKQKEYVTFLLPGFKSSQIRGVIDPRDIAIEFEEKNDLRKKLNDLKEKIQKDFQLNINVNRWEFCRERFINSIFVNSAYNLNLLNSDTFCIGDTKNRGCKVVKETFTKESAEIELDFLQTKSDLCSFAVYTEIENWYQAACNDSSIWFEAKGEAGLKKIYIEIHFENKNIKRDVDLTDNLKSYQYKLQDICSGLEQWKKVREVAFLVERQDAGEKCGFVVQNVACR